MPRDTISAFTGINVFLSNFSWAVVRYEGIEYNTVEHAYQAAKTLDPEQRLTVQNAPTPGLAKSLGQRVTKRPDWDEIKLGIMADLLKQKFLTGNPKLTEQLLGTRDMWLIEGNTWRDQFYGCTKDRLTAGWVGHNHLGRMLMTVRDQIQFQKPDLLTWDLYPEPQPWIAP